MLLSEFRVWHIVKQMKRQRLLCFAFMSKFTPQHQLPLIFPIVAPSWKSSPQYYCHFSHTPKHLLLVSPIALNRDWNFTSDEKWKKKIKKVADVEETPTKNGYRGRSETNTKKKEKHLMARKHIKKRKTWVFWTITTALVVFFFTS